MCHSPLSPQELNLAQECIYLANAFGACILKKLGVRLIRNCLTYSFLNQIWGDEPSRDDYKLQ